MIVPRFIADRYEIGDTLGHGGMSEVHRATDTILGRDVAIKIMHPELAREASFYERFRREAQNSALLNHPSIVGIYDTGEQQSSDGVLPYIVMELVEGVTLRDIVRGEGPMSEERALGTMADVAGAVDFSHRKGIIHRDVKPANVMIDTAGAVKVMDFGISRAISESTSTITSTSAVLGTAQYLSPEQARGETVDIRSDVYSAGCVLYELLTGRPPFVGDSTVAVAYQHVKQAPLPPSKYRHAISPYVDAVVMQALAKNPDNRYQTAGEFRSDLLTVLSGNRPSAPLLLAHDEDDETSPFTDRGYETTNWASAAGPANGRADSNGIDSAHGDSPDGMGSKFDTDSEPVYNTGHRTGSSQAVPNGVRSATKGPRRRTVVIAALLLLLLGSGAFVATIFNSGEDPGAPPIQQVTLPQLTNVDEQAAKTQLTQMGLRVEQRLQSDPSIETGFVITTDPVAGKRVEVGSPIVLVVSIGKPIIAVPKVIGLDPRDARRTIEQAGLTVADEQPGRASSVDDSGKVVSQQPIEGASISADQPIVLTVGTGPEQVRVPSVVGLSVDEARSILQESGLRVDTTEVDSTEVADQVLSQAPSGVGQQTKGSTVTLQVSRGNRFIVPQLVGRTVPEALQILERAGWQGGPGQLLRLPQVEPDLPKVGKIFSQQPNGGEAGIRDQIVVRVVQFGIVPGPR